MYGHWKCHSQLQVTIAFKSLSCQAHQIPFWRVTELPSVVRKEKLETLQQLRQERKEEEAENFSKQRRRRTCSFKSLLSFLLYPLGLQHIQIVSLMGFHIHPHSLLSSLGSEKVLKWVLSVPRLTRWIQARALTPLQRSFSSSLPIFSPVPKSKVPKEGNLEQCFSMVCKSSNSRRSLIFVHPAFTALRGLLN